jgi:hypothetical protein
MRPRIEPTTETDRSDPAAARRALDLEARAPDALGRALGLGVAASLAGKADRALVLTETAEAGPMGLAPTRSTMRMTAAEALGVMDANNIANPFAIEDGRPVGIVRMHDRRRVGVA